MSENDIKAADARDDVGGEEQGPRWGVLAEYDSPGALIEGAAAIRRAGYTKWDCYSPFPVHGIDPAMGIKMTVLPWIVFVGGLAGLGGGLLLQWWTNAYDWPWLTSGKPYFSLPANIPIMFETTVLLSAFSAFFGMWALNKLPQVWHPLHRSDRFIKVTDNGFFIAIEAADPEFDGDATSALLSSSGATAVEDVHLDPDPRKKEIPRVLIALIIVTTAMAVVPFVYTARARASKSALPHYHVFAGMDFQFKSKAQQKSDLFADQRATRPRVAGTVARGQLRADDHYYRGLVAGDAGDMWATSFPQQVELGPWLMNRGRERYDIFCAPCHGLAGYGDGMVHSRALQVPGKWVPPTSIHGELIIKQPHGQLFNTISNGIRNMPGYAKQLGEEDRWAIVFYMRALQRSQNAAIDDAPAGKLATSGDGAAPAGGDGAAPAGGGVAPAGGGAAPAGGDGAAPAGGDGAAPAGGDGAAPAGGGAAPAGAAGDGTQPAAQPAAGAGN